MRNRRGRDAEDAREGGRQPGHLQRRTSTGPHARCIGVSRTPTESGFRPWAGDTRTGYPRRRVHGAPTPRERRIQEDEMSEAMQATARELVAPGRGILAADESTGTIKKRFDQIGVGSTEDLRRRYRQMLFTTPGLGEHISGVILFDETIRQATDDGVPFVKVLEAAGSIPGIKVDTGAKPLALFAGETVTEGLDGLRERLAEYVQLGARFAKWRATILIGDGTPTDFAIMANAHAMARDAAPCQEAGGVPIVEPGILMGGAHADRKRVVEGKRGELGG